MGWAPTPTIDGAAIVQLDQKAPVIMERNYTPAQNGVEERTERGWSRSRAVLPGEATGQDGATPRWTVLPVGCVSTAAENSSLFRSKSPPPMGR
jgi:hypothetical protein